MKTVIYWVNEVGGDEVGGDTYRSGAYLEHIDSPPPSSSPGDKRGHFSTFEAWCVCVLLCVDGSTHPRTSHRLIFFLIFVFFSSACFTSQCKCGSLWMKVRLWDVCGSIWRIGGGGERLRMFHSVGKHAEHRTLNTYTQQLVLSKCSCCFFFFVLFSRHRVALGYTEHKATNRTRVDRLLQTTTFVYMLCMPHR